jgi:hypothetical protein
MQLRRWKELAALAFTSYLCVLLITFNVWAISKNKFATALITSFLISLTWTFNVKSVAIGNWIEKLIYSFGALLGTATGLLLTNIL